MEKEKSQEKLSPLPWAHLQNKGYPNLLRLEDPRVLKAAGFYLDRENRPNSVSAHIETWDKWLKEKNPMIYEGAEHSCKGCGTPLYDMWVQCFSGWCAFCMKAMMKPGTSATATTVVIKDSKIVAKEKASDDGVSYESACEEGLRSLEEEAVAQSYVYGRRDPPALVAPSEAKQDPLRPEESAESISFKDLEDPDVENWPCCPM